ncbi:MAG: DUF4330 family protein [Candidatus Altiarchaeales archaeon]|nr:DUF4330 family protein [Candidatus Altiarchaeales archaeon]MBD3415520.1 DUF4330 family protein [Candidatus Altiarchaeales archaeon]
MRSKQGLVDGEGRLMGKVNIIDLFVLLVILLVLLWGLNRILFPKPMEWVDVESIVCFVGEAREDFRVEDCMMAHNDRVSSFFEPGMVMRDESGDVIARIEEVKTIDQGGNNRIYLKIKLKARKYGGEIFFRENPLKIDTAHDFTSDILAFKHLVQDIEGSNPVVSERKTLLLSDKDVPPEFVGSYEVGLAEHDSAGSKIAELVDVSASPSKMIVVTESGDVLVKEHPFNKDLELEVVVEADMIGGEYYYKMGQELKTGHDIRILGDKFEFEAKIIDVMG